MDIKGFRSETEGPIIGETTGYLPNVYFGHALSFAELRRSSTFLALPPKEALCLLNERCYMYLRQDDNLWSLLHTGVCTTSCIAASIGLLEPGAVKRLRLPKGRGSHSHMLDAYHRLCGKQVPPPREEDRCIECREIKDEREAHKYNIATIAAYNRGKGIVTWDSSEEQHLNGSKSRNNVAQDLETEDSLSNEKEKVSQLENSIKETKSVNHMTDCVLSLPEKSQGVKVNSRCDKNGNERNRNRDKRYINRNKPDLNIKCEGNLRHSDDEREQYLLKRSRQLGSQGPMAVCCAWGNIQEAVSLEELCKLFPRSRVAEVGLFMLHELPEDWGFRAGSLPPIGASPDAMIWHPTNCHDGNVEVFDTKKISKDAQRNTGNFDAHGIDQLLECMGILNSNKKFSDRTLGESRRECKVAANGHWEVVEIKNICPFAISQSRTNNRRKQKFIVNNRSPSLQLNASWIPQLQLHMICSGTSSALLLNRSALRGLRIFRVKRNDAYIRAMLQVLSIFWRQYVLSRRLPPKDVFADLKEHHDMIKMTKLIIENAEVVMDVSAEQLLHPKGDRRLFLD